MRFSLAFLAALVVLTRAESPDKRQVSGPACVKQDITFMLDSSSYIGVENFLQQLEFVKNNIRYYNINPSCTQVSVVTYSNGAYNQFFLNGYHTQNALINAIGNIKYQPGGSNSGEALNYMTSTSFLANHGGRAGVPHYGVLVTGSSSSNSQQTVSAANKARASGMTLFTVGVGSGINRGELSSVSGGVPKNQFYAQNYNALGSVSSPLATRINGAVTPITSSTLGAPSSCLQQADIVFMVDGSGSIGSGNFLKLENFVKGIVGKLDVNSNKVHVGLVQFSNYPKQEFPLSMHLNRQDVMTGVDSMHYMSGGTNTADALKYLRTTMFSQSNGARSGVPRIGVVITDGRSSNPTATANEANAARRENIGLIAVGVGGGVDTNELHAIANDPDSANTFQVANYDQLNNIATQITNRACQVQTTSAPATAAPAGTTGPDPCHDALPDCANYNKSVCSGTYFGWARDNCPRYCGFCVPLYTTAPPPCVDTLSNCNEYQATSCVGQFEGWAKTNCRKYCGYCDSTSQTTGFYGRCYYKGKSYRQGENWDDGCDYTCTCVNSMTGSYRCSNKCPVYHNLPAQCTLVKDEKACCLQPVCNFNPQITTTETISPGKTTDGINVCTYKGHQYYQGQTWDDGCQYTCTCKDATTGTYKCQNLCPAYSSIPSNCHMVRKPGECCQKPVCEFNTQTGSFMGQGTISSHGTKLSATAPPQCVDVRTDCLKYGDNACINFVPWARDNCRKTCNLCVGTAPKPSTTDVCIYEGKAFHQGDSWKVGCDKTCTCEDAVYGYYRCVSTCPVYNNLPQGCQETKKAGDCCATVQCTPGSGTFTSSTGNLATIGNGGLIYTGNGPVPTLPTGGTPAPGTGGTSYVPPSLQGCLYKGKMYVQGQIFDDGCQYSCECMDGATGQYKCNAKCPTFSTIPSECHLEVDPSDPCCQRPKCQFTGTPQPVLPSYVPSITGHNAVKPPSPGELYQGTQTVIAQFTLPGSSNGPMTAKPGTNVGIGHCEYKGHIYKQADTWEDGCQYNCICEDASIGFYRCREKCARYPPLPQYCTMVQDPKNTCCKIPSCQFVGVLTTGIGHGVVTTQGPVITTIAVQTPPPRNNMCVYKTQMYGQSQTWYDGCELKCTCDDATNNFYKCQKRCPEFFNVDPSCTYVTDPNDPACCKVPQCIPTPPPGQTNAPGVIPTLAPGTFVGQPNTGTNIGYCSYKGRTYTQGQTWKDGCEYDCSCTDAMKGKYECVDRCPTYPPLPAGCRMIADFTNPCCQKPQCNFTPTIGEITGTLAPTPRPGHTLAPGVKPTISPVPQYCVYKGGMYSQGQSWNDGCQYRCRCDDATKGLYVCDDRCPAYPAMPAGCKLVTDPSDSCCQMPQCSFVPSTGQITGTLAPNMIPTKVPGQITGQANTPAPTPGPMGTTRAPMPLTYCEYKGTQHKQGETWDDGCDYTCRCLDATKGKYVCDEMCPKYPVMPPQCHLIKDAAKPCCFRPVCDFPPTYNQLTGQGTTLAPNPNPQNTPAPIPGQTPAPTLSPNPNPNPYPTPGLPKAVCNYKMDQYTQGQEWFDGCNFKCVCEDAAAGVYRCNKRCAQYTSLPAGCTLVADPKDPLCCRVPSCNPSPQNPNPTPPPGHITGGIVTPAPMPMPQNTPVPMPGQTPAPTPAPVPKNVCIYKGKSYTQGQKWQDGCDYNCECVNSMSGLYDCTEMCAKYPNLPAQCRLVQDYNKPCCQVPSCSFTGTTNAITGHLTTPVPKPGDTPAPQPNPQPTIAPKPKQLCKYNGVTFRQGQRWDDGCDLQCVCENEMTGYYRCNQRCPSYPSVPAGCSLETDPSDPCCRVPKCVAPTPAPVVLPTPAPGHTLAPNPMVTPNPNPTPYIPQTQAPPIINGQGVTPTPMPGVTTLSPPMPVCVYNGKSYSQGQKWQDGCQYDCECVNGMNGQYRCTEHCPIYNNLPSYCRMVTSTTDACCKQPECTQPQPQPTPSPNFTPAPNPNPGTVTMTPNPNPNPHPNPNPQNTPVPNPNQTPAPQPLPQPKYCVMNGKSYTQGQKWNDGCTQMCVCDDSMTGHYTCSPRCKTYASIPKECTMVPDPSDPMCCQVPQCIPVPGTNGNPTPSPTDKPIIYTNAPLPIFTATGTPPTMPTPVPQPGVTTPVPAPKPQVCMYKGRAYQQGQRWQDGCEYSCVCDNGMTGKYTCTQRCGDYPNMPRQCHLIRDPSDYCCFVPQCDWLQPTPAPNQTPAPTPVPQPVNTPQPQPGTPSPFPTQAPIPGVQPTPVPNPLQTPAPVPRSFCVMNGVTFAQGQTIDDGCQRRCRCDNADTNYYNCYDRCPNYPNVPAGCIMVTDPKDACCQIPECTYAPTPAPNMTPAPIPGQTPAPGVNPTPAPGVNPTPVPGVNPYPSPVPTAVPGQIISNPDPTRPPTQRGFCEYKGMKYTKGQTWDDGCQYNCVCLDDMTGQYKCTERCPRYPSIPTYCVMVQDPNDHCCTTPSCPGLTPTLAPGMTPAPVPGQTPSPYQTPAPFNTPAPNPFTTISPNPNPQVQTPAPFPTQQPQPVPKNVCIMSGKAYTQGQQWYDGCKQICVCDDGMTGHYTCNERCPTYPNVPSTCVYIPDPSDTCCQIPKCDSPGSPTPRPVVGTHTGTNPVPTPAPMATPSPLLPGQTRAPTQPTMAPLPGQTPVPQPGFTFAPTPQPQPKACVYKNNMYTQGQTWRDGCQYDCKCDDASTGKYTCTDICPKYPGLPYYCQMVYDPMNPCCKKPECSTPAPNPQNTPAPLPGQTPVPNPNPQPSINFCVYKGVPLRKGQTYDDGCDKICRCEDTMTNDVVCDQRCATYPPLQRGCSMMTDPNDPCCQVPQCQPINPPTNPNTTTITGVPGTITGTSQVQPNPGTGTSGKRTGCMYHGVVYKTGDKWTDQCSYNCICVDDMTGNYRCTERCAKFPRVPAQCSMVQDPADACCQKPYCPYIAPTPAPNYTPAPGINPTLAPNPNPNTIQPNPNPVNTPAPNPNPVATPAPQPMPNVCMYKNQMYQQNQVWYDDCKAICKCEDASTGYYRCQERCAKYPAVPSGCTMVPDPKDPTCCKVAYCAPPPTMVPNPTPGYQVPNPNTPAPPKITGVAPVPTPQPQPQNTPAPLPGQVTPAPQPKQIGCFFNGKVYRQGQRFDDGCQYKCICMNDMTGQYSCTKRCQDYPQLATQCVLVQNPNDTCCQVPYCDYVNPTPFPNGIPTPAPNPFLTPVPGSPVTTLSPGPQTPRPQGYCVYKGVYYTQGQRWNDGCDKTCTCDDVSTGYYSCNSRCPSYQNPPANCKLVTDPNDNCCLVPDCSSSLIPTQQPGISGTRPSATLQPGTGSPITGTNPPQVVSPTYIPATFTGTGNNNPYGQTGTGPNGQRNVCVYKAQVYQQGQSWDDGCQFKCQCVDSNKGMYRCTERCPRYVNLPSYCSYQQDPRDNCCKVASCDLSRYTPAPPTPTPGFPYNPNTNPGITGTKLPYNPNTNPGFTGANTNPPITYNPGHNTGPSGSHTNPTPGVITGNRDKCVYKDNSIHGQGMTWQDGCQNCICENPASNQYKCTERCKVYSDLPSSCYLTNDPADSCCKIPRCGGSLQPAISGSGPQPTGTNVVPVGTHTMFTGNGTPRPGGTGTTGSRNVCIYKGTTHQQGESWDDGCDYTCTCSDSTTGTYSCVSKCPTYPPTVPSYCKMSKIPGMCCESLTCNIPNVGNYHPTPQLNPTPAPTPAPGQTAAPFTVSPQVIYPSGTQPIIGGGHKYPGNGYAVPPGVTSGSITNQCVYKSRIYNQGESWEDGCDYKCTCLDSTSGYYQCKPLCPQYQLPASCYTVTAAGQCCQQPICRNTDGSTFNPITSPNPNFPVYGSYTPGITGFRPGYSPSTGTAITGTSRVCIYKGKFYNQGQKWDDACDYTCECTDASSGMYTCNPLCPTYTSLPKSCHMQTVPGQCCQVPKCPTSPVTNPVNPVTPTPHSGGCTDSISNCASYGAQACRSPYEDWARKNCMNFCNLCPATAAPMTGNCVDKLSNCASYGTQGCTGAYEPWARDNCRKTCNLCTGTPSPFITQAPIPSFNCVDKLSNCNLYGASSCQDPYVEWALDNCKKTCNLCQYVATTPSTVTGSVPNNNWMIMLKGVAGVPGDLYQLWHGSGTANPNVPQAMYLTNQYKGHYKPDLSNYWSSLCIDKVKVAIFNNGQEKANIIFNAIGADKNTWFDPSRIISSTWTDIRYAPKSLFSMLGEQQYGHEFVMSSTGSGCNSRGWIMVSNGNNCGFERGDQKPAFYYSAGQTSTSFTQTNPLTGDVFAILAHPNCQTGVTQPPTGFTVTSPNVCIYKGKIYNQGDSWQDGCQYNCTCEDATSGFYRCKDLCPVWNNLPQGCTLQKKTGECCAQPVCPGGVNPANACVYKGNYYAQDQSWKDGCQYKCTCKNGQTGFYECSTLCLTWSNLPPTCHMEAAPAGMCCQTPKCPSNVQISYPPGYVQQ